MSTRPLHFIGLVIRAARRKRGLTQQRAAKAAGVSRPQFARLEDGFNVSVVFLQKVLRSLDIAIAIGEGRPIANVSLPTESIEVLLQFADDLSAFADRARVIAFEAALPSSGRDASAITAFVLEHAASSPDADASRLARAMQQMTRDVESTRSRRSESPKKARRQHTSRKR